MTCSVVRLNYLMKLNVLMNSTENEDVFNFGGLFWFCVKEKRLVKGQVPPCGRLTLILDFKKSCYWKTKGRLQKLISEAASLSKKRSFAVKGIGSVEKGAVLGFAKDGDLVHQFLLLLLFAVYFYFYVMTVDSM